MMVKVLLFVKKYPMSILLAVIAIQLANISGKLEMSGRLSADRRACLRLYTFQRENINTEKSQKEALKTAKSIGVSPRGLTYYCNNLI